MAIKSYKDRWINNPDWHSFLKRIEKLFKEGGKLEKGDPSFDLSGDGYLDFRGIDFNSYIIKKVNLENVDMSFSNLSSTWIEQSLFKDVVFDKVDFSSMSDHGNEFLNCTFSNCKFNRTAFGYDGTKFANCTFDNSNFTRSIFIRGEFTKCVFKNNKLKGVDFNASSFEDCSFIGKLEDVWFRGDFPLSSDVKEFGEARKNKMKNVSFEEAVLTGLTFSNKCDLSTIKLPNKGEYFLFNNWKNKLEKVKRETMKWTIQQRKEGEIFINSYFVHAQTQDWYLLNADDLYNSFGIEVGEKIITSFKT